MTRLHRHLTALVACTAALGAAGCGDEEEGDPIPQDNVSAIETQLDNIRGQIDNGSVGACNDIFAEDGTFVALEAAVNSVPDRVDADVKDALTASVNRLGELAEQECNDLTEDTETTPEETETVTIPETVPEETEPTETQPPPEDEQEETPPEDETPPEEVPPESPPGQGEPGGGAPAPEDGE